MVYETLALLFGWFLFGVIFIPLVLLWFRGEKKLVIRILINILITWLIVKVLKMVVPTERPYTILGATDLAKFMLNNLESFPSAHAAVSFAIAGTIWDEKHRFGLITLVLALLISIGRVMLNVHYPIDVIVGSIIGILVVMLAKPLVAKILLKLS